VVLSRYRNTQIIDGKFYGTTEYPTRAQLDTVPTYSIRVSRFDRLDNLAFKNLGSGEYWFIIALINDLDWAFGFEEGQILKIPVNIDDVLRMM
jgi:hypothetical protein